MSAMINVACVQCMRGDHAEAAQLLDQALVVADEAGDGMRMCESLVIRSEVNRPQGKLSAAAVDAERALSEADAWGYRLWLPPDIGSVLGSWPQPAEWTRLHARRPWPSGPLLS